MDWPDTVGVVGGGVVGLATAYSVAARARAARSTPATSVTVYERDEPGAGSTTRAGCGLRTFYTTRTNVRLAQAGLRFWRRTEQTLGVDVNFRENGYCFLTDDGDTAAELDRQVRRQRAYGGPAFACTPEAVDRVPGLHAGHYRRAVIAPAAGVADPELMVEALLAGCERENVTVRTETPVTDLDRVDDGVRVGTPEGTETVDRLVNAAGGWAPRVAAMLGDDLPVEPRRRRIAVLDADAPAGLPLTVDLDSGVYFLPGPDGRLLAGGHFSATPTVDPDAALTRERNPDYERDLLDRARHCTAVFDGTTVAESWTGMYAMTDSRVPIVERADGVVHAAGFSGHGIMQAPGAGQVAADLVAGRRPSLASAAELARDRPTVAPDIQF